MRIQLSFFRVTQNTGEFPTHAPTHTYTTLPKQITFINFQYVHIEYNCWENTYPSSCSPRLTFSSESIPLQLNWFPHWSQWVIFYLFELRRDIYVVCEIWRQDISSLSTSFLTHLYLTHLPWRIPLSEVHYFLFFIHSTFLPSLEFSLSACVPFDLQTFKLILPPERETIFSSYFCLVLQSHHKSQFHSHYTPFLLFSIPGFILILLMPLCAWSSVKSTQLFLCPPNPSPSPHFCNFICQDSEVLPLLFRKFFSLFMVPGPTASLSVGFPCL